MKITLDSNPNDAPGCIKIVADDGQDRLIQTDWDWPGIASTFGWSIADVVPDESQPRTAYFNRFELTLPGAAVPDCSHQGQCDEDVEYWAGKIERPAEITPEKLAAELKEYGAWDSEELADDAANWQRLIWQAACQIKEEEPCEHDGTDGTVACPHCGLPAGAFIQAARQWIDDNDGAEVDDPGYFEESEAAQ